MIIKEIAFEGVFEIRLEPHHDSRGFFMRTYDDELFERHGMNTRWVQENHSLSLEQGVVRGIHFQLPPHTETKLIRVIRGKIYDVFVDLRRGSSTFGRWHGVQLSSDNKTMLYLPRGFAHGYCTLEKNCEVIYKVDRYYAADSEGGIRWNDPDLDIIWPVESAVLSEKDSKAGSFRDFVATTGCL